MIDKKDWAEFRNTGLLLFVNQFLHIFGWALVLNIENDVIKSVYPARVKFRGFDEKSVSDAHIKLGEYMKENAEILSEETKE